MDCLFGALVARDFEIDSFGELRAPIHECLGEVKLAWEVFFLFGFCADWMTASTSTTTTPHTYFSSTGTATSAPSCSNLRISLPKPLVGLTSLLEVFPSPDDNASANGSSSSKGSKSGASSFSVGHEKTDSQSEISVVVPGSEDVV
eukprot:c10594_g1_i2.p1 GENE.c10594_g1_i2~~c10594_g1_i2.p1  ORF type:complete len:146 (+),score=24.88 c10594_g1_i2:286-723(+)